MNLRLLPISVVPRFSIFLAFALITSAALVLLLYTTLQSRGDSPCSFVSPAWIYEMHPWSDLKAHFSQGSQDWYLEKIFSVVGSTNRYFVEFGFNEQSYTSGGSGANTGLLYSKGWRGLLLDGKRENTKINLHKHYLFASNIAGVFAQYGVPKELDYLSCDMDSHDLWVFRAILEAGYRPRVITTEYNNNYPLSDALTLIDPTLLGNGSIPAGFSFDFAGCAWGTSARALWKVATLYGYRMVGRVGPFDLVWLREDLIHKCFLVPQFEWFFRNAQLGQLHHYPQITAKYLDQIADYDTFTATKDLAASNQVARSILRTRNLPCFEKVRSSL